MAIDHTQFVRAGWRVLLSLWIEGNGRAPYQWLWEREIAEEVNKTPPGVDDEHLDRALAVMLHPRSGPLLERIGNSRRKGLKIQLTRKGAAEAQKQIRKLKDSMSN